MQVHIVPALKLLSECDCILFKDYNTYKRKITDHLDLADILRIQGDPIIDSMRIYLAQLFNKEPFWNDHPATGLTIQYQCDIEETPNCITEAYERDGIVFSFRHHNFDAVFLRLTRNEVCCNVRNACDCSMLKEHLNELGVIELWRQNSFMIHNIGYKFEIRFQEDHHNVAHFHVSNSDYSASFSIPDVDLLAGALPAETERKIVSWAFTNMPHIIEMWNLYHPERLAKQ